MKYFILQADSTCCIGPRLINWREKLNPILFCKEDFYKIPKHVIITMESTDNTIYQEIISPPNFFVSELMMHIIKMYRNPILSRDVILMDPCRRENIRYYMIILDEFLGYESGTHNNKRKIFIDKETIEDRNIFLINIKKKKEIIIDLCFAESLLRRGAMGIQLEEIILNTKKETIL